MYGIFGSLVAFAEVAEGIGRAVHAHEALAGADGVIECLFSFGGDRRVLVAAGSCQVAGRLKHEDIPLADLVGLEHPPVLGCHDLEAGLLGDVGKDLRGVRRLVAMLGNHGVLGIRSSW